MDNIPEKINVSFCLPVYNVEKYVDLAIRSILKVEGITYEVVLVDDLSTDNSYKIISDYKSKYDNIRVYQNQENKGVSYTRNRLIKEARGEFIWFVDPDDMIVPFMAETFYNTAIKENVNCVYANHLCVAEDSEDVSVYGNCKDYKVIENKYIQLKDGYTCKNVVNINEIGTLVVWQGLINRDFLINNKISFYDELFLGEDLLFHYDILLHLDKFIKFDGVCYNYRIRSGSAISKSKTEAKLIKSYKNSFYMYDLFKKYIEEEKYDGNNNVTSKPWLEKMMFLSAVNVIKTLVKIKDKKYFNEQLKIVKNKKIFTLIRKDKSKYLTGKNKLYVSFICNNSRLKLVRLFTKK